LEVELVLAESFQDEASDPMVFLQHLGVNEDVIEVYTHYALCYEVPEDVVHYGLEGGGAVGESKEHNEWLKQSPVGLEGGLPLIPFLDMHIVVTPLNIQFSDELQLVYAAKLPSLLLQGSAVAPIVLVESLPMRKHQRRGIQEV
ncbi:hypothetical protein C0989_010011, partial [Termitomyces sp. Mn162]